MGLAFLPALLAVYASPQLEGGDGSIALRPSVRYAFVALLGSTLVVMVPLMFVHLAMVAGLDLLLRWIRTRDRSIGRALLTLVAVALAVAGLGLLHVYRARPGELATTVQSMTGRKVPTTAPLQDGQYVVPPSRSHTLPR